MLEGNEIEKKIGNYGQLTVDITPELKIKAKAEVEVDLVAELKALAEKTSTPIDDKAAAALEWVRDVLLKSKASA